MSVRVWIAVALVVGALAATVLVVLVAPDRGEPVAPRVAKVERPAGAAPGAPAPVAAAKATPSPERAAQAAKAWNGLLSGETPPEEPEEDEPPPVWTPPYRALADGPGSPPRPDDNGPFPVGVSGLKTVFETRAPELQECVKTHLPTFSKRQIVVGVTVVSDGAGGGKVTGADVKFESDPPETFRPLLGCVLQTIEGVRFLDPERERTVQYPIFLR